MKQLSTVPAYRISLFHICSNIFGDTVGTYQRHKKGPKFENVSANVREKIETKNMR
jgi:hypothetical protein